MPHSLASSMGLYHAQLLGRRRFREVVDHRMWLEASGCSDRLLLLALLLGQVPWLGYRIWFGVLLRALSGCGSWDVTRTVCGGRGWFRSFVVSGNDLIWWLWDEVKRECSDIRVGHDFLCTEIYCKLRVLERTVTLLWKQPRQPRNLYFSSQVHSNSRHETYVVTVGFNNRFVESHA